MVQYKSNDYKKDDYWKLKLRVRESRDFIHDGLNKLKFQFNTSTGGARLAYLVTRAERGMMSYEKCNLAELKAFCLARKIQGVDQSSRKKRQLIALLEHDDDDGASFNRLFDLPPELRNRIYSFYLDSLGGFHGYCISQHRSEDEISMKEYRPPPPVTQVCTAMRKETMPMFFDILRPQMSVTSSAKASTREFSIKTIPTHLLSYARKISLNGFVPLPFTEQFSRMCGFQVKLNFATPHTAVRIVDIQIPSPWCWMSKEETRTAVLDAVKEQLTRLIEAQQVAEGSMTMLTKDLYDALSDFASRVDKQVEAQLR